MPTCSYPSSPLISRCPYMHFPTRLPPHADPIDPGRLISRRVSAHSCTFLPFYLFAFRLWFLKAVFLNTRLLAQDGGPACRTNWMTFYVWKPFCCNIYQSPTICSVQYCFHCFIFFNRLLYRHHIYLLYIYIYFFIVT